MTRPEKRTPAQDKAIRLFSYLQELVQLRAPQVRNVESYEKVLWFSELPHEEGCYSISWGAPLEDSDLWVEVKKRKEPPCPTPPENCAEWLNPAELRQSDAEPKLRARILAPTGDSGSNANVDMAHQLALYRHQQTGTATTPVEDNNRTISSVSSRPSTVIRCEEMETA